LPTLASTSGHPLGSHVHVNSETTCAHWSGSEVQTPEVPWKHQPHPSSGVHVPQVVNCWHPYGSPPAYGPPPPLLSSPHAPRGSAIAVARRIAA
jgi:hypothetical protein